jgi:hypothetical protein
MDNAVSLLQALVLEDARRWGDAAQAWQREDAEAILDLSSPTPYSFLTRGRGGSKTGDLAGVALAAMLAQAPPGARLYAAAADRDQARLFADSIGGFKARTPELRGALEVQAYRVVSPRKDAVLEILAADAAGAWGLRPWLLLIDEVCQWPSTPSARAFFEALTSAAAKLPEGRMALLSSAGDPAHWSRGVLDHALSDPLWRVHEVPGPVPWLDPARVEEQRRRLPESSFRRLFLNEWVSGEDRVASVEDLRACVTLEGPQEPRPDVFYVAGVDLGLKQDRTVVAICHGERLAGAEDPLVGARVVLDRLKVWQGSRRSPVRLDDVEEWIAAAAPRYNDAICVIDPWQAGGLMQRLQGRAVAVEEFTFSAQSVGRLAATLTLLIRNHAFALPDDDALLAELANLRLKETSPGVFRIDHDPDKHDDRAIALALAAHKLAQEAWLQPETGSSPPPLDDPRAEYLRQWYQREREQAEETEFDRWEAGLSW